MKGIYREMAEVVISTLEKVQDREIKVTILSFYLYGLVLGVKSITKKERE